MEIIKTLQIKINQADVEKAIIKLIAEEDPAIVVDAINFKAKRNGDEDIAVTVDAHLSNCVPTGFVISEESVRVREPVIEVAEGEEEEEEEAVEAPAPASSIFAPR